MWKREDDFSISKRVFLAVSYTILSIHGLAVGELLNPGAQLTPVPCWRQKCTPTDLPKSLSTKTLQSNDRLKYKSNRLHSHLVNKVTCKEYKVGEKGGKGFCCPSKKEEECMLLFGGGQQAGQTWLYSAQVLKILYVYLTDTYTHVRSQNRCMVIFLTLYS